MQGSHEGWARRLLALDDDLPFPPKARAMIEGAEKILSRRGPSNEFNYAELAILIAVSGGDAEADKLKADKAERMKTREAEIEAELQEIDKKAIEAEVAEEKAAAAALRSQKMKDVWARKRAAKEAEKAEVATA